MISPTRMRRSSGASDFYSPGLERLSEKIFGRGTKKKATVKNPTEKKTKGRQTFIKLTSASQSDFQSKWALLIFTINLYNLFTVPLFLGIQAFPSGVWLALEISFEIIFIIDYISRIIFKRFEIWKRLWMLHEKTGYLHLVSLLISSVPYSFLSLVIGLDLEGYTVASLRALKLLRLFQFFTWFSNQEIISKAPEGLKMRIFKNLILLLGTIHYSGMLLALIARIEIDNGDTGTWLQPWIDGGARKYEIYIDSVFWATATLSTIGYNDTTPTTLAEKYASSFIMVIGASICAWISGSIVSALITLKFKEYETQEKIDRVKKWCRLRHLTPKLSKRIITYYSSIRNQFSYIIDVEFLKELPNSLRGEISTVLHEDMIPKVSLFEMAEPSFVLEIVKYLKPSIFMKGDFIIRQGDYGEEMFFVKVGIVEVIAADAEIIIANLHEGDYFGEIGALLNVRRTVSVRAQTAAMISSIAKEDLTRILKDYPDYYDFLVKVGKQRMTTTNMEDFDFTSEIQKEDNTPVFENEGNENDNMKSEDNQDSTEKQDIWWLRSFIYNDKHDPKHQDLIIDPFSTFFYLWCILLSLAFGFYLFYIPFAIAFEFPVYGVWLGFDIVSYIIYLIDMPIHLKTAIFTQLGTYTRDPSVLQKNYLNRYLLWDIISVIPIDFICEASGSYQYVPAFLRIIRLFKCKRIYRLYKYFFYNSHATLSYVRLVTLFIFTIYISHFIACISFYLGKLQYWIDPDTRFNHQNFINSFPLNHYYPPGTGILDIPIYDQYVNLLYFGYSISSSGAYGDVPVPTVAEKVLNIFFNISSMILAAFIIGEAASLASSYHKNQTEYLKKLKVIKEWMSHCNLSMDLQRRILNYYLLLWSELQGYDDEEIMQDFPETLRTDIKFCLFSDLTKSGFFPEEEKGAILSIVRKYRLSNVCKGETIVSEGELGLEMYFILDGEVEVVSSAGVTLNSIKSGSLFGEMALLNDYPSVRIATVRAKTDVTIAILSINDFNFIMSAYPEFSKKIRKIAAERTIMNRTTMQNAGIEFPMLPIFTVRTLMTEEGSDDYFSKDEQTDRVETKDENSPANEVAVSYFKISRILVKFHNSKLKHYLYFVLNFYNFIFVPLQIAFEYEFSPAFLLFEVLSIILYLSYSFYYWNLYQILSFAPYSLIKLKLKGPKPRRPIYKCIHNFLMAIPFALIFWLSDLHEPRELVAIFSVIRITGCYYIVEFFDYMKRQFLCIFTLLRILEVIVIYVMVNHFSGAFFIECAKREDTMHSWLSRVPSPQPNEFRTSSSAPLTRQTVYIHAFHWSSIVVSHAGYGQVVSNSPSEKAYNCFIFLIGLFAFSILFGSITSLVAEMTSNLQFKFLKSYNFVKDFIAKKFLDDNFSEEIDEYFDYLQKCNKGINDKEILKELPSGLMVEIKMCRYSEAIEQSQIFKINGRVDEELAKSIFRLLEIEIYLVGDPIIHAGEKSHDLFIILDGEVDIVNFCGKRIVMTLTTGNHFGEISVFIDAIRSRPFNAIATSVCQIGLLKVEHIELLRDAFPEWHQEMLAMAQNRLAQVFTAENVECAIAEYERVYQKFQKFPNSSIKYYNRTENLMESKIQNILSKKQSYTWRNIAIIHMAFLIYTSIELPLEIGFEIPHNGFLLTIEILCLVVSLTFFLVNLKYSFLFRNKWNNENDEWVNEDSPYCFYLDIIALLPFNPILTSLGVENPYYFIAFLRSVRIIAVFRLFSLFDRLGRQMKDILTELNVLEASIALLICIHWMSCLMWYYSLHEVHYSWINLNNLEHTGVGNEYSWGLFYILNIITCTGYGFMHEANDSERVWTMFWIFLGDIMNAIVFGLMATAAATSKSELIYYMEKLNSPFCMSQGSEKMKKLIKELESYNSFSTSLRLVYGPIDYNQLFLHIPQNLSKSIIFECTKLMLEKVPCFQFSDSHKIFEKIAIYLKPKIFLPKDYIIFKDEDCDEMYFVIEGSVVLISSDNKAMLKTLRKGSFIGDVELLTEEKPNFSVIAKSMCYTYSLHRNDLMKFSEKYPDIYEQIQKRVVKNNGLPLNFINQESMDEYESAKLYNNDLGNVLDIYTTINVPQFNKHHKSRRNTLSDKKKRRMRRSMTQIGSQVFQRKTSPAKIDESRLSRENDKKGVNYDVENMSME